MQEVNTSIAEEEQKQTAPASPPDPKKYGVLSRLRSYLILDPLIFLLSGIFGLASMVCSFLPGRERVMHSIARAWAGLVMKLTFSPVKIAGAENINPGKNCVYAVNHASALDIPLLYHYLPFEFRIIHKKELLTYPVIGRHLKQSGQFCIDQQHPTRSVASIRGALKSLRSGIPLVIFPEGGRTPDGEIKPFLPGAFFLAIKAQVDIVPIRLVGMFDLLPMNTYHIKCRPLEMHVGEPIPTAGLTGRDMDALSNRVEEKLTALGS